MKYFPSIFFLFIAVFIFPENDFRNVNWGMSKEEVLKLETGGIIYNNDRDSLDYKVNFNGDALKLRYSFSDDKLIGAGYYDDTYIENFSINEYKNYQDFFIKNKNFFDTKCGKSLFPDKYNDYFIFYDTNNNLKQNINKDFTNYINKTDKENNINYVFTYCIKYIYKNTVIVLFVFHYTDCGSKLILSAPLETYLKENKLYKQNAGGENKKK